MPDNATPLDAASPGKQLGEIGEGIGKVADGVSKAVDAAEKAANAAVENKNNRWPVIRFWALFVIAIAVLVQQCRNNKSDSVVGQGKIDAATERYIKSLENENAELKAERKEDKAIMYGQDTALRNSRMSNERLINLSLLKSSK